MKVLMVITSHDQLGNTGRKTGFWLEELAAPYFVFKDAGVEITLASPKGGRPPLDPKSNEPEFRTDLTRPVREGRGCGSSVGQDRSPRQRQARRLRHRLLSGRPRPDVGSRRRRSIPSNLSSPSLPPASQSRIVCHSTGALHHVKTADGKFFVQGKEVTGFTNGEEEEMGLTKVVPFLVEDEMLRLGAVFSKVKDWGVHVVKRRLADHGTKSSFLRPCREDTDGGGKGKGHTGGLAS